MDAFAERLETGKQYIRRPINEVLPPSLLLYLIPPLPPIRLVLAVLLVAVLLLIRLWSILPSRRGQTLSMNQDPTRYKNGLTVGVFLGSGGHTTELLQLVSALPTDRYTQRIYLVSSGDRFSLDKSRELERRILSAAVQGGKVSLDAPREGTPAKVIQIPRARKVHQSFLTTPLSLARSVLFCIDQVAFRPLFRTKNRTLADVILMNGPGTCVPIVAAVYLLRIFGSPSPKLIYVESFARVKSFSLTAKLVRPFVDRFVLQWPRDPAKTDSLTNATATSNTVHSGWLV